jgi:glyoxylase-like metal-dependent hydrolase (beta-lactamase superfamily II)
MDGIPLPSYEIVKLDHFAPGVSGLRVLFVNVFGIAAPKGWTLVDAGLVFSASTIMEWAKEHFGGVPPQSIVLTHGHFDHVGVVTELLEHWGCSGLCSCTRASLSDAAIEVSASRSQRWWWTDGGNLSALPSHFGRPERPCPGAPRTWSDPFATRMELHA